MLKKAFTLIELTISIAIIGLIAALVFIYFNNSLQKARDLQRFNDVKQIQTALQSYYATEHEYPPTLNFGEALIGSTSSTTYMKIIPNNPRPRDEGSCLDKNYNYSNQNNGKSYILSFCLGGKINNFSGCVMTSPNSMVQSYCVPNIGLSLWLEADGNVTTRTSGVDSYVTEWKDMSGNNNDAVQAIETIQPKLINNTLNGKPVVRFDGVDDFMVFTEINNIRSAFFVIKHQTGSGNYEPLLGHSSLYDWHGGENNYLMVCYPKILNGQIYNNGSLIACANVLKPVDYAILSFITSDNVSAEYITNDRNFSRVWNGDYAEIILYNRALSVTERQSVEKYLGQKYNITISN